MGKLSFLLIAAIGITALIATGRSLTNDRVAEAQTLSSLEADVRARDAALSGYAEATQTLAAPGVVGSVALPPLTGTHGGGTYRTTFEVVTATPFEVRVRVTGQAEEQGGEAHDHVVEGTLRAQETVPAVYSDPNLTLGQVPPYMRYAAFAGRDMSFMAFPSVRPNGSGFNSNIHANNRMNMTFTLPIGTVAKGFGTYSGGILKPLFLFNPKPNFRPEVNPAGDETVRKVANVAFPDFTASSLLRGIAGDAGQTATSVLDLLESVEKTSRFATELRVGRTELLGDVHLGTRENPRIIYVEGDLVVFNPRHHGYGIYLVTGNVIYEGTLSGLLGWLFGKPESQVAYYVNKSVFFNGIGDVHGQIVAGGNVSFNLAPTFYGSVTARGDVSFLGMPTLRFTSPSPSLTTILPGNPSGGEVMKEVSFREWEAGEVEA